MVLRKNKSSQIYLQTIIPKSSSTTVRRTQPRSSPKPRPPRRLTTLLVAAGASLLPDHLPRPQTTSLQGRLHPRLGLKHPSVSEHKLPPVPPQPPPPRPPRRPPSPGRPQAAPPPHSIPFSRDLDLLSSSTSSLLFLEQSLQPPRAPLLRQQLLHEDPLRARVSNPFLNLCCGHWN